MAAGDDETRRRTPDPERIVWRLREADRMIGQRERVVEVLRHLEVPEATTAGGVSSMGDESV